MIHEFNLHSPVREIPCPDTCACNAVHREHTGEQTLTVRGDAVDVQLITQVAYTLIERDRKARDDD